MKISGVYNLSDEKFGLTKKTLPNGFSETIRLKKEDDATGIILGRTQNRIIELDTEAASDTRNILVMGPAGTHKTYSFVTSYCEQAIKRGESLVLTTRKSETHLHNALRLYCEQTHCEIKILENQIAFDFTGIAATRLCVYVCIYDAYFSCDLSVSEMHEMTKHQIDLLCKKIENGLSGQSKLDIPVTFVFDDFSCQNCFSGVNIEKFISTAENKNIHFVFVMQRYEQTPQYESLYSDCTTHIIQSRFAIANELDYTAQICPQANLSVDDWQNAINQLTMEEWLVCTSGNPPFIARKYIPKVYR